MRIFLGALRPISTCVSFAHLCTIEDPVLRAMEDPASVLVLTTCRAPSVQNVFLRMGPSRICSFLTFPFPCVSRSDTALVVVSSPFLNLVSTAPILAPLPVNFSCHVCVGSHAGAPHMRLDHLVFPGLPFTASTVATSSTTHSSIFLMFFVPVSFRVVLMALSCRSTSCVCPHVWVSLSMSPERFPLFIHGSSSLCALSFSLSSNVPFPVLCV